MDAKTLQARLGYEFASRALLQQALTHRSHSGSHNERLEFLGDSVLNCVIASMLFEKFSRIDEGDLSRLRANLVKQQSLYEIAQRLELSQHLRLGEGELKSGGFRRPSILADTVEALFGAIFLDGGFEAARRTITQLYLPVLEIVDPKTLGKDAKTLLQEYLQSRKVALPVYTVVATHGAAHNQEFEVECAVPKLSIQVLGSGGSRRAAEQAAAKKALEAAQSLALQAGKRTRKPKPAQLSLPVAVVQAPDESAGPKSVADTGDAAAAEAAAGKASSTENKASGLVDARKTESGADGTGGLEREKAGKADGGLDKLGKVDRTEKTEKSEKAGERAEKPEKADKVDKIDQSGSTDKTGKTQEESIAETGPQPVNENTQSMGEQNNAAPKARAA